MNYFKYLLYLYVFIGYSLSSAGAYDDFFKAIEFDRSEQVQQLLERGFDPNSPNPKGQPALMVAMQQSSNKVVDLLVNWPSTNLSIKNPQGETPLMLAALNNKLSLAKLLIQRGAAASVSSLMYLVPPSTAIMAWMLFDEPITAIILVGTALTALGVSQVVRTPKR
jgi:ankyrin repeat protein